MSKCCLVWFKREFLPYKEKVLEAGKYLLKSKVV